MLSHRQFAVCAALATVFWIVATLAIHYVPESFTDPAMGAVGFVVSIPVGWLCVRLTRHLARLQAPQIPTACLAIVAIATSLDGAALHFAPSIYSPDEQTRRLAAAWLLWGYGVSAFMALIMASSAGGETVAHGKAN